MFFSQVGGGGHNFNPFNYPERPALQLGKKAVFSRGGQPDFHPLKCRDRSALQLDTKPAFSEEGRKGFPLISMLREAAVFL